MTVGFPSQRASNMETISMTWFNMNILTPWVFKSFASHLPSPFCPNLSTIKILVRRCFAMKAVCWHQSPSWHRHPPTGLYCVVGMKIFDIFIFTCLIQQCQWYDLYLKTNETGYHCSSEWYFTVYQGKSSINSKQYATKMFTNDNIFTYGIRGNCLNWFQSYLSNCKQFVTYNGVSSPVNRITCGMPQGSILGPLLFLLYINDLGKICSSTTSILFADDTNIFKMGNNLKEMEDELNSELSKISIWLKANKLSLFIGKTHFMVFSNKRRKHYDLNIKIDGTKIEEVKKKTKFLGVIIDNKLTWKDHVAHVASKVSRGMDMIIKARNYLNRKGLLTL